MCYDSSHFNFLCAGLILFMFFLGLELDPGLMRRSIRLGAPIAVSAVLVPFSIGAAMSSWIYTEYAGPTVGRVGFTLFFGAAMSFTAFPVLAAILQTNKLLADPMGMLAFSCAAIDDVLAWCVLAFATSFASSPKPQNGVYTTLLATAYVLIMVFIVRPLLKKVNVYFKNHNAPLEPGHFRRSHITIMLLMLLASSLATETIGIHAFFGAFVAGCVVPKEDNLADILAPKIELIVMDFLLPLYFANSGLKLNMTTISSSGTDAGAIIAIISAACIGKFVPTFFMTRIITKRPWRFCASLGVLMNTRGLVELIVLNIGLDLGILSVKLFTIMV